MLKFLKVQFPAQIIYINTQKKASGLFLIHSFLPHFPTVT